MTHWPNAFVARTSPDGNPSDALATFSWSVAAANAPTVSVSSLLAAGDRPQVHTLLTAGDEARPRVFSAQLAGRLTTASSVSLAAPPFKVISVQFAPAGAWKKPALPAQPVTAPVIAAGTDPQAAPPPTTRTRIQPPRDVIKLEDRLFYLLQPSLEALVGDSSLSFPQHPFRYQFEGIAFLYPRFAAVLADEMGLGKTMQALTAMRLLLHTGEVSNILLVCPKPLVTNWQREFAYWAPEIPIATIEGDQAKRRWQWTQDDLPIKLANYEVITRDREIMAELDLKFDLVVLDEAQRIKNRHSATSQCVREIARRRSWALTGTPIENSPQDLVGIFEFLAPGYLNDTMKPRKMGQAAADYVLRRTKDKVLTELPPKMFRDAEVDLSPAQRATYEMAEKEGVIQLTAMGTEATIQHVFELVLRLKQICNFDPVTGDSSKFERLAADLDEVAASGRKAIVFSQWVKTLDTLGERLAHLNPLAYHGRIPPRDRDGVLDQFRHDKERHVLLLSYGAGGVGLNLQFSEYVFLFDRWWNPAVEDQAINRAHRIGAKGQVTVTRFLALETIEQRIDQVLREKREIFDSIFSDVEPTNKIGLTQSEIFGLFKLRCPTGPIDVAA